MASKKPKSPIVAEPEGENTIPAAISRSGSILSTRSAASSHATRMSKRSSRMRSARQDSFVSADESSSDDGSSDEEPYVDLKTLRAQSELPNDFWQVQKVVRYLKIGNQTATIIALCNLVDYDLTKDYCQLAIMDAGGLEVLANLLETEDFKCKFGSLRVLRLITVHPIIRRSVTLMGGIELMIRILSDSSQELQLLAAETLANLAKFKGARRIVRKQGGIPKLVDLLDVDTSSYFEKPQPNSDDEEDLDEEDEEAKELKPSDDSDLTLSVKVARGAAHANLQTESHKLKMLCASAIFRLAEEDDSRHLVRLHGGLDLLVDLIAEPENQENKELMAAVTGAIWKCATGNSENIERFQELELMELLIRLLRDNSDALDDLQFNPQKMGVLTNVVGAIAECTAASQQNINTIKAENGLAPLIRLINTNGADLLVNVSRGLGACANDRDALERMRKLDGVRLLWSLLKHPSEKVQASAAWALSPCIRNANNAGDMVRSFVGGLELICSLLTSKDTNVLAAVCFAIANIARDKENLAVITDHGVIEKLSKLANTEVDRLRAKLAEAIANCCDWAGNRAMFGQAGAVAPLVNYLTSSSIEVHRSTSVALYQLSKDPWNCVTMHQSGVVPHLLRLIGSEDEEVQEASADCLQNIRKLALACEKFRYQHMATK